MSPIPIDPETELEMKCATCQWFQHTSEDPKLDYQGECGVFSCDCTTQVMHNSLLSSLGKPKRPPRWCPKEGMTVEQSTTPSEHGYDLARNESTRDAADRIRKLWTPTEDEYLIAHYFDEPKEDMCKFLGRTLYGAMGRYRYLTMMKDGVRDDL